MGSKVPRRRRPPPPARHNPLVVCPRLPSWIYRRGTPPPGFHPSPAAPGVPRAGAAPCVAPLAPGSGAAGVSRWPMIPRKRRRAADGEDASSDDDAAEEDPHPRTPLSALV